MFAFARVRELGVDVERLDERPASESIVARYFSAKEIAQWRSLSPETRTQGFFRFWACKEAYIKARGEGMGIALNSFSVILKPQREPVLHAADESRWKLLSLEPAPGFAGAIVGEGHEWRHLCDWDQEPLT